MGGGEEVRAHDAVGAGGLGAHLRAGREGGIGWVAGWAGGCGGWLGGREGGRNAQAMLAPSLR